MSIGTCFSRKIISTATVLIAALFFVRCSSHSPVAGGGASDQGNAIVVGRVVNPDATPGAFAVVTILPQSFIPGPSMAIPKGQADTADADGRYTLHVSDTGLCVLYAAGVGDTSALLRYGIDIAANIDTLRRANDTLAATCARSVLAHSGSDTVRGILAIRGTPVYRTVDTVTSGYVLFQNAPSDVGAVITLTNDAGTPVVVQDVVLLDDFTDGNAFNLLDPLTGNGFWHAYSDQDSGGSSAVIPIEAVTDFGRAVTSVDSWSGNYIRVQMVLQSGAYVSPYAGFRTNLSAGETHYIDFSAMTALSFMCKGRGSVRVQFSTRGAIEPYAESDRWGQLGSSVDCPAEWQRIVIPVDSLLPPSGSLQFADNLQWRDVSSAVNALIFSGWSAVGDTTEIGIDDICLIGVSPAVFKK